MATPILNDMINDSTPTHRPVDKTVNRVGSCAVLAGGWIPTHDRFAARYSFRRPYPLREFAEAGGLLSYGAGVVDACGAVMQTIDPSRKWSVHRSKSRMIKAALDTPAD
jgi:hypothetical protein